MRAFCALLIVAAAGLWLPQTAEAQGDTDGTLSSCVARVVGQARAAGAKPYGDPRVDFLLSGERVAFDYQLPHDGCFGFVAVGHRQVQHLGLVLYASNGRVLSHGGARNAHAYARACGKAGRRFVVEARMLDGEGEVHLVPLWNAPDRLTSLSPTLANCMDAGVARPSPVDVGPEPLGPPMDVALRAVTKRLLAQGYRMQNGMFYGELGEREQEARRVLLEGGRCYGLAAVGDARVEDIDLRLLSTSATPSVVAQDTTRRRDAVVKHCPTQTAIYLLDVRMFRGAGDYLVQAYELSAPSSAPVGALHGEMRIPYAETSARLGALGMQTEALTWGLLQPGETQVVPLHLSAGECYAVGALSSTDFATGDLDISLMDERGGFAAGEQGPGKNPVVFHCAKESAVFKAVLRGYDVRRPSRFLLVLGKAQEAPAATFAEIHARMSP